MSTRPLYGIDEHNFVFQGEVVETIGDIARAMRTVWESGDLILRDAFMGAYKFSSKYAYANIGYMTGYFDTKTMCSMLRFFEVEHPVFGSAKDIELA